MTGDGGGGPDTDESMMKAYLFFVLFPHQLQGDGPKMFKFENFKNNKLKKNNLTNSFI
jgi:hypothetical protein